MFMVYITTRSGTLSEVLSLLMLIAGCWFSRWTNGRTMDGWIGWVNIVLMLINKASFFLYLS